MRSACTSEIDDVDDAVAEIVEQLDLEKGLLQNSVGILGCNSEYLELGTVEELCKRLPFEVIGSTAMASSTCGKYGAELLSLSVLTSDDVTFATACTEPLTSGDIGEVRDLIKTAYDRARAKLSEDPSLVIAAFPVVMDVGGSTVLGEIDNLCGGVPVFGVVAIDQLLRFESSFTIWNGTRHPSSVVLLLMQGNVNPTFHLTAFPEKNVQKQKAIITEADGCLLKKVNEMLFMDYLSTLGLTRKDANATGAVPLLVDYGSGTKPVAIGIYRITPEGYAVCGSEPPVGSALSLGVINYDGIMETAELSLKNVKNRKEINGVLMFPCMSRAQMISPNSMDEMKKVIDTLGSEVPYMLCYSGGEICPIYGGDGKIYNHFHNFTFTACVF
ncbi:MAG: FIST C-terminal domain-containing protein [Synergistaceae bacterium]|nr:FIST C-terminal domain-containing protein [Synergistaceae bacterium]